MSNRLRSVWLVTALLGLMLGAAAPTHAASPSWLARLAAAPSVSASTVASNGDQNPYGVAVVPQ
ncbi:MAG: hypothetical protein JOZ41_07055, partial [Chloroflexi bacterium]|nr:hypothetical protein [Chloroflexota bacterium]